MDPDQDTTVVDNGVAPATETVTTENSDANGGVTSDIESWKKENKVPYLRFEEVTRANQEFRDSFTKELGTIKELLNNSKQPNPQNVSTSIWDEKAKSAKSWGEFVKDIQEDTFKQWESRQKENEAKAEQELKKEVQGLKSAGLASTDTEVNAIMKFAVKKSEELKQSIPLAVAARWYKETYKAPDNKDAAGKVLSPKKNSGGADKNGTSYKDIRSKSLDEIVLEAKEHAPQG